MQALAVSREAHLWQRLQRGLHEHSVSLPPFSEDVAAGAHRIQLLRGCGRLQLAYDEMA
jgi:hypothetical protein